MFFALPRIKIGRRFFAKTVLSEGAGAASPQGRNGHVRCAKDGLRFLRRCEKIYKSASRAFENGDHKGRKPGNNAARGIIYEMELRGMGLERYPF